MNPRKSKVTLNIFRKGRMPRFYSGAFCAVRDGDHIIVRPVHPADTHASDLQELQEIQNVIQDVFTASGYPSRAASLSDRIANWSLGSLTALVIVLEVIGRLNVRVPPLPSTVVFILLVVTTLSTIIAYVLKVGQAALQVREQRNKPKRLFFQKPLAAEIHGIAVLAERFRSRNLNHALKCSKDERTFSLVTGAAFVGVVLFFANPIASLGTDALKHNPALVQRVLPNIIALGPGVVALLTVLAVGINLPAFRLARAAYLLELAIDRQHEAAAPSVQHRRLPSV